MSGLNWTRRFALLAVAALLLGCSPAVHPPLPTRTPTFLPPSTPTPPPTSVASFPPTSTPVPAPVPTLAPQPLPTYWPTQGWKTCTPEQQGIDSQRLLKLFDLIKTNRAAIHSVLIVRDGYLVMEAYAPTFGPDTKHEMYSCTKSVTSALVGIAVEKGYIGSVQNRVLYFFPERTFAHTDSRKRAMTLEHLLIMASGLDWPEHATLYSSPDNIVRQMGLSADPLQFMLDRPMAEDPGTHFNYSSGDSHLLALVLQETTGISPLSFARAHLFQPLGVSDADWLSDRNGVSFGASALMLKPRDMAKFGYLYLKGGVWEGRQVISSEWVKASVENHIDATSGSGYGYQWWVHSFGFFSARGLLGQFIFVIPGKQIVVVFTGGLGEAGTMLPQTLLWSGILPAVKSSQPLPENPEGVAALAGRVQALGVQ